MSAEVVLVGFSITFPPGTFTRWPVGVWIPMPTWKQRMAEHLAVYAKLEPHGA